MTIWAVYEAEPKFPATDQHPDAVRYFIDPYWVDAIGGEPSGAEVTAFIAPAVRPPHLNFGGLVRFAGTAPVSVYENIRLGAVTRVSKGRWRTNLVDAIPDGFSPIVSYIDAAVRNVRVSAITANYVEVKAVDAAGAAADCQQVIVKIERVINS